MCFAKKRFSGPVHPHFLEDGSIDVDDSYKPCVIPNDILHHIDSVHLLKYFDIEHKDAIYGFVYESGYEIIIVYTSDEAEQLYENLTTEDDPFDNDSSDSVSSVAKEGLLNQSTIFEQDFADRNSAQLISDEQLNVENSTSTAEASLDFEEPLYKDSLYEQCYYYQDSDESYSDCSVSDCEEQ